MSKGRVVIHIFRQDLRIHDNEALCWAFKEADCVLPLYCFDPRHYEKTHVFKFQRMSPLRIQFTIDCVKDLRQSLKRIGSTLIVRRGTPGSVLEQVLSTLGRDYVKAVTMQKEVCSEEVAVETEVKDVCKDIPLKLFWGSTLYHRDDLPFQITQLPDVYTDFRKMVESRCKVRNVFPDAPATSSGLPPLEEGAIPEVADFGAAPAVFNPSSAFPFKGGESGAVQRLRSYLWDTDHVATYKETRNGMIGSDYSTKFSPWLAYGCLSPRKIFSEIKTYERQRTANQSTYWVLFELIWRDYFHFVGLKFGTALFWETGIRGIKLQWKKDMNLFNAWAEGRTGVPYVDANMRELKATGFMSNRGRQNVASFLTKDLKLDWRLGAEWFESQLLDHDPCSNYGNWLYVAGLGNDPRSDRKFNVIKQGLDYDPSGEYVRLWVPELKGLASGEVHAPWSLPAGRHRSAGLELGANYPRPVVIAPEWKKHQGRGAAGEGGGGRGRSAGQKRGIDFYFSRPQK